MRRLVPPAIHTIATSGDPRGVIDGAAVSFDIVGSTSIAAEMATMGSVGAARFADLLDATFDPVVRSAHRHGGFVAHFAGDGALVVLPDADAATAAQVTDAALEGAATRGGAPLRAGAAVGRIDWAVWATAQRRIVVWGGPPIAEATAGATHREVEPSTSPAPVAVLAPPGGLSEGEQKEASVLPGILWDIKARGEFRRVVSCFLRIGPDITDREVEAVLDLSHDFRGYLKDAEFVSNDRGSLGFTLFWGAPTAREGDTDRALGFITALGRSIEPDRVRAGISDGTVFAGFMGGPVQSAYACLGAPVHLAARLSSVAEPGVTLTDQAVTESSRVWTFRPGGLVNVRGFEVPVSVHQVAGRSSGPPKHDIVGRDAATQEITTSLTGDGPVTVAVRGPGGMGKSAVLSAVRERLDGEMTFIVVEADRVRSDPLGVWRTISRAALGVTRTLEPDRRRRRFEAALRLLGNRAPHLGQELERSRGALAAMTDVDLGRAAWNDLPPEERMEAAVAAALALASAIAVDRRLVLVFEDVTWADQPSLDLLRRFLSRRSDPEVSVLLTTRDRLDLPIDSTVELGPLDDRAIAELATAYGAGPADIDLVTERAGGNPYFARQLARWIASTRGTDEASLPGDLLGLLTAQIDQLPAEHRQIVQTAAVLGRSFDPDVLDWMTGNVAEQVLPDGVSRGIWTVDSGRVNFANDLIREAAAAMPIPGEMKRIHDAAASALVAVHPDRDDLAAEVASHLRAAGREREAVPHLFRAGVHAAANFANADALRHLSDSADLAADQDDRRRALREAIVVADTIADRESQAELVERLRALARTHPPALLDALLSGVAFHIGVGEWAEAAELLDAWTGPSTGDIHLMAAGVCRHQGNTAGARTRALEARAAFDDARDPRGIAATIDLEGGLAWDEGQTDEAVRLHRRAVGLFAGLDDPVKELGALNNLGTALWAQGNLDAARMVHTRAVERSREVGLRLREGDSIDGLGGIAWTVGDDATALDRYQEALALRRRIRDEWGVSISLSNLGIAHRRSGRLDESLSDYTEGVDLARRIGRTRGVAYALTGLGVTLTRLGRYQGAISALQEAREIRVGLDDTGLLPETDSHLSVALAAAGLDPSEPAERAWLAGPDRFASAEDPAEAALALHRVLTDRGRGADAAEVIGDAARLLRDRAARAGSPEMAFGLVERVAANAEILALAGPERNEPGHVDPARTRR